MQFAPSPPAPRCHNVQVEIPHTLGCHPGSQPRHDTTCCCTCTQLPPPLLNTSLPLPRG
jgi:hypothetical protein